METKQLDDHETRIRQLETINIQLSQLVMGAEGNSILKRLDNIDDKLEKMNSFIEHYADDIKNLDEMRGHIKIQKFMNSATFKIIIVVIGAIVGFIAKHIWVGLFL